MSRWGIVSNSGSDIRLPIGRFAAKAISIAALALGSGGLAGCASYGEKQFGVEDRAKSSNPARDARAEATGTVTQAAIRPHNPSQGAQIYYKVKRPSGVSQVSPIAPTSTKGPTLPILDTSWPPPAPSTFYEYPKDILDHFKTAQDVSDAVTKALRGAKLTERVFFACPGGFVMVVRAEQIDAAGHRTTEPVEKNFIGRDTYKHRIFVFLLSTDIRQDSQKNLTFQQTIEWMRRGDLVLDQQTASIAVLKLHHLYVFVYEFSGPEGNETIQPFRISARDHLALAGIALAPLVRKTKIINGKSSTADAIPPDSEK